MKNQTLLVSLVLGLLVALLVSGSAPPDAWALGSTRQVSPGGTDTGNCIGSPCASISYALTQAVNGDVIDVAAGTYTDTFTVAISVTIQGAGAGATVVQAANEPATATSRVVTISSGVSVTLQALTIQYGNAAAGGGGILNSGGTATVNDCTLLANTALGGGGGIFNSNGTLVVDHSTFSYNVADNVGGGLGNVGASAVVTVAHGTRFEHNQASAGGGVSNWDGTMTLDDTTVYSNTVTSDGGGILNYRGATLFVANGTTVQGNTADDFGGGIVNDDATLIVDDGTVVDNEAWIGGGLFQYIGSTTLTGALVQGNRSGDDVGGIAIQDGTVTITATQILSNVAQADGGGISIIGGSLDVANSVINYNTAGDDGGAIDNDGASTTRVVSCTIRYNTANDDGGAVDADADIVIEDSIIQGNRAGDPYAPGTNDGGGIDLDAGSLIVTATQILSNTAQGFGGGISSIVPVTVRDSTIAYNTAGEVGGGVWTNSTLTLNATRLVGNAAVTGGGVYHEGLNSGRLVNVLLADNVATGNGAGLYLASAGRVDVTHATIAGSASNDRQGVYVANGAVYVFDTIVAGYATGIQRVGGTVSEDYNLFYDNGVDQVGTITSGGNSLPGDPRFVAPGSGDYHLATGSVAIDNGTAMGVLVDFEGDARYQGLGYDVGYDESPYSQTAGVAVAKTATPTTAAPGETLTYTYRVTNTGGFRLSGVVAVDDVLGSVSLGSSSLDPAAWTTGVLTYTVVAADLPGPLTNTVVVTGTPTVGADVTATDSATVEVPYHYLYLPLTFRDY